jgi:hypothetical protein
MADREFVEALSGTEIINDVLTQIRKAMERDCNLRSSDAYGRGYSGKITLHLECFALDAAAVDMAIDLHPSKQLLDSTPETPPDADGRDVKMDMELEIPLVSNLDAVRDRSTESKAAPAPEVEDTQGPRRRSYGKPPTVGGAVDVTDTDA